jgi:hypothetical protein
MTSVFISYANPDFGLANELHKWLEQNSFQGFLDHHPDSGIQLGSLWEKALYERIRTSHAMILVVTPAWIESKWCFFECAYARALGKQIFPLLMKPCPASNLISDIQSLDLTGGDKKKLSQLQAALLDVGETTSGGFGREKARSPFPGLVSFEEEDAAVFFGRNDEIRAACERVRLQATVGGGGFILFLGASGVGKSSLLRAGIIPRLKADRNRWIVLPPFRPGANATSEFFRTLSEVEASSGAAVGPDERQAAVHPAKRLSRLVARLKADRPDTKIIVAIDQLEELFTLTSEGSRKALVELISLALESRDFIFLATLRSDYLSEFQTLAFSNTTEVIVRPISLHALPEIIRGPAELAGLKVQESVIDAARLDAETGDALPLLAFTLRELFERMSPGATTIARADYDALGDPAAGLNPIQNAVKKVADQTMTALKPDPDELRAFQNCLLLQLTNMTDDGRVVRRAVEWLKIEPRILNLLERLTAARVLSISYREGIKFVEVAHEALLRHWQVAKTWIDENREFLLWKKRLSEERLAWQAVDDDQKFSALLSGARLAQANHWLKAKRELLDREDQLFIEISDGVELISARQQRRDQILARLAIFLLPIFMIYGLFAWYLKIH